MITACERLKELVFGGPGDYRLWTVMVILAARADEAGIVLKPPPDEVAEWVHREGTKWGAWCLRQLEREGWIRDHDATHWDISVGVRKGLPRINSVDWAP